MVYRPYAIVILNHWKQYAELDYTAIYANIRTPAEFEKAQLQKFANPSVTCLHGNAMKVKLPSNYFVAAFVSNFLEHLDNQTQVAEFLEKLYESIRSGGKICILGPNFRYSWKSYYDFADHKVALSELGVVEHLYGAGFEIETIIPRLLPLSFRSSKLLPVNKITVGIYLTLPIVWKIMGKQFLVVGVKK